ncbi:MAG: hypothetical protein ABFD54_17715 [Armatimonadota bacterium]|nr:hypothetical protein [bacterium]
MLRKLADLIITIAVGLFYICVFASIIMLGLAKYEKSAIVKVRNQVPEYYPILVVSQSNSSDLYKAKVVYQWALRDYLQKNPHYSFTVSSGHEVEINKQLSIQNREVSSDNNINRCSSSGGKFRVRCLSGGRQAFIVEGNKDDNHVNKSWYMADAKHIYPQRYVNYFGPGLCMAYGPIALVAVLVVAFIDSRIRKKLSLSIPPANIPNPMRKPALIASLICIGAAAIIMFSAGQLPSLAYHIGLVITVAASVVSEVLSFWVVHL